ncbi:Uncharacterized protein pbN1_37980 [Aromatoleum bremense]|nr:Uncharacterized protein pbN1_37980 [Aromatoleum bremense]
MHKREFRWVAPGQAAATPTHTLPSAGKFCITGVLVLDQGTH